VTLLGCPESKAVVIRLGVDCSNVSPVSWEKRLQKEPSVIFLGRLTEKKNPIALIHAFALVRKSVPNAKLTIIGDGPLREKVEKRIESLGLQTAVTMFGALDQVAAWNKMRNHWIYAQHSVSSVSGDQEGFALSLAESAAHELPVVSTWHNGIPENVIHGKTGFLVREFDFEKMAERIVELMLDPKLMKAMGKAGRKNVSKKFKNDRRYSEIREVVVSASLKH